MTAKLIFLAHAVTLSNSKVKEACGALIIVVGNLDLAKHVHQTRIHFYLCKFVYNYDLVNSFPVLDF